MIVLNLLATQCFWVVLFYNKQGKGMRNKIIIAVITTMASIGMAHGVTCSTAACDPFKNYTDKDPEPDYHCFTGGPTYICTSGSARVPTCSDCAAGYEKVYKTYIWNDCDNFPITYTRCQKSSTGGGTGGGTTTPTCYTRIGDTTDLQGTGCVEYKPDTGSTNTVLCSSCNAGCSVPLTSLTLCDGGTAQGYSCFCTLERCSIGNYYNSNMRRCIACPDGGTTANGSATSAQECYLPTGTEFTDDAGSGTYKEDCYYTD